MKRYNLNRIKSNIASHPASLFGMREFKKKLCTVEKDDKKTDINHKTLQVLSAPYNPSHKNAKPLTGKNCSKVVYSTGPPNGSSTIQKNVIQGNNRNSFTKLAVLGTRYLTNTTQFFANNNPTKTEFKIKNKSKRKTTKDEIAHQLATQELISQISSSFINAEHENLDFTINQSLEKIGAFYDADRSYLFFSSPDKSKISNKYEWSRIGINPQIVNLQNIQCEKELPWFSNKINRLENIYVNNIQYSPMGFAEKQHFIKQDILSLLVVPLCKQKELFGFLGFDYVVKSPGNFQQIFKVLRTIGEIFLQALENRNSFLALRKEQLFLNLLMDNIPDTIYFKDQHSRFTKINKAQAKTLGISNPKDAIGKTDADFFAPAFTKKALGDEIQIIKNNKNFHDIEEKVVRSDGQEFWASVTKVPLRDNQGKITGLVGISRDITERVQRRKKREGIIELTTFLLGPDKLPQKLDNVVTKIAEILDLMVARIWLKRSEDICNSTCSFGPDNLIDKNFTKNTENLQLFASTEENKSSNGTRNPVPLGMSTINKLASLNENKISSNDLTSDLTIKDLLCVKRCGLQSFAAYKLNSKENRILGILEVFSKHKISIDDDILLETLSHNLAQVLHTNKAEAAYKHSEKKFRKLFDEAPVGYHEIDKNGIIVTVNQTELKLLGYSANDMIGKPVWEFAAEKGVKERVLGKLQTEVNKHGIEIKYKKKNGELLPVIIHDKILSDETGTYIGVRSTLQDNTFREKALKALSGSEDKFRSISQSATDAIVSADQNGNIIFWNNSAKNIFGFSEEEIIGKSVENIMPESYQKSHYSYLKRIIDGEKPRLDGKAHEMIGRNKDGHEFPIELSPSIWKSNGQYFFSAIIRNIEQRKTLEKQLSQSHKMEAIGTLAGGIAHDFNNILGAIMGYAELSIDEVDTNSNTSDNLEKLLISAGRAKDLVKQILIFSRMDESKVQPMNIQKTVLETLSLLQSTIPTTIQMVKNIQADNSYILGDPCQIHQILLNLCNNAVFAFGDNTGIITISLLAAGNNTSKKLPSSHNGEYVELVVNDSGCGMSDTITGKIFDPFFTTKDVGEGTGLGLSVIDGIIKKMGGTISVSSTVGEGSTFTVLIPVIKNQHISGPGKLLKEPRGTETILFVDDESDLVEIAINKFKSLGYTVLGENKSLNAFDLFKRNFDKFDLIITDQAMPQMTGKELSQSILQLRPDIPIILCTGYSDTLNKQNALDLGIKKFLYKPVNIRELARVTRKVLDESRVKEKQEIEL